MDFSEIASAVGGFLVICYLVWQVIVKLLGDKDWFQKRKKAREAQHLLEEKERLKAVIVETVPPMLDELKAHNQAQDEKLSKLICSSNDMLRLEIVKIYYRYRPYGRILQYDKEALVKLYHDYTAQGGNSFVKSIYKEMQDWTMVNSDKDLRA